MDDRLRNVFLSYIKMNESEKANLSSEDSTSTLENWDSLAHVNVISGIEKEYKIRIPVPDAIKLIQISKIESYLKDKSPTAP